MCASTLTQIWVRDPIMKDPTILFAPVPVEPKEKHGDGETQEQERGPAVPLWHNCRYEEKDGHDGHGSRQRDPPRRKVFIEISGPAPEYPYLSLQSSVSQENACHRVSEKSVDEIAFHHLEPNVHIDGSPGDALGADSDDTCRMFCWQFSPV